LKILAQKRLVERLKGVGPEFKPQYCKKKRKEKERKGRKEGRKETIPIKVGSRTSGTQS
jgi:hypothetical protein